MLCKGFNHQTIPYRSILLEPQLGTNNKWPASTFLAYFFFQQEVHLKWYDAIEDWFHFRLQQFIPLNDWSFSSKRNKIKIPISTEKEPHQTLSTLVEVVFQNVMNVLTFIFTSDLNDGVGWLVYSSLLGFHGGSISAAIEMTGSWGLVGHRSLEKDLPHFCWWYIKGDRLKFAAVMFHGTELYLMTNRRLTFRARLVGKYISPCSSSAINESAPRMI